jgi:ribonuclease III
MPSDVAVLEAALGYEFRRREPLQRALTHKSRAYEQSSSGDCVADNEQLEFLGDAVLGFVVSDVLLRQFPSYSEGQLTKLRAQLVSETHLHEVAQTLSLGEYLLLGRGEEMSGGRAKKALLADALEAIIAAAYLDGGLAAARHIIERHVIGRAEALDVAVPGVNDYKSALQHLAQSLRLPQPRYAIIRSNGPEHAKTFTVEARVGAQWVGQADGPSKKSASQRAAQLILEHLGTTTEPHP